MCESDSLCNSTIVIKLLIGIGGKDHTMGRREQFYKVYFVEEMN